MIESSETSEILLHIHELLREKDPDASVVGGMDLDTDSLQLMDRAISLTASILPSEGQHPSMVHCHVRAVIQGEFDSNLDACVVGIDPVREMALFDVSRIWVDLVAGPILSLLHARPVLDAVHFDGTETFAVPGCHGFAGPIGYRFVDKSEDAEQAAAPFFDFAESISPPGIVHLAKATLDGVNRKQWRHTIEIDGHDSRHTEIPRQGISFRPHGGIAIRFATFHFADRPDAIQQRIDLDHAIRRYIELHDRDDTTAVDARYLEESEDRGLAHRIVQFVPSACARVMFAADVARWPQNYVLAKRGGDVEEKELLRVPEYARTLALSDQLSSQLPDQFKRVVLRSAELNEINQALHQGSKIQDLSVMPSIVPDGQASQSDVDLARASLAQSFKPKKPWWKIW